MIFLSDFIFPDSAAESGFLDNDANQKVKMTCYDTYYPFAVLPLLGLQKLSFDEPITLLYGNNGSGKTTIFMIRFLYWSLLYAVYIWNTISKTNKGR